MFGKFFASAFTGSMMGAGSHVFAVWGYVIANTINGQVELNAKHLAAIIGSDEESMKRAIEYLCSPDENSRSGKEEGRRLIKEGQFAYKVVNHTEYRKIRDEEGRREYNRIKQREHRKRSNHVKAFVNDSQTCQPMSAHTEAEAEAEADKEKLTCTQGTLLPSATARSKQFQKPSLDEVKLQMSKVGLPVTEAEHFMAYYESNGWRVGRNPMKSWVAAITNWKIRHNEHQGAYLQNNGAHRQSHPDHSSGF